MKRFAVALTVVVLAGCTDSPPPATPTPSVTSSSKSAVAAVEVFSRGLEIPWDVAFLPDGRLLVTERKGQVRLVERDGRVHDNPVARVETSAVGEGGLLGIDLDPQFAAGQRFAYLYVTTAQGMQVQRWRVAANTTMTQDAVVLGGITAGAVHDSGRLRFGPDGDLYVLTGDAGQSELSQDRKSLNGKVLRLNEQQYRSTTSTPTIVSLGHRNPQGLDWQPGSNRLVISDHGPSGGQSCCDEVDVIVAGGNYGWPEVFGKDHGKFRAPAKLWQETIAPSGAAFVSRRGSAWTGSLLVAALRGESLRRLTFDGDRVVAEQVLYDGTYGRLRAVSEGPDGAIYVSTSNRDGRGDPTGDDDRILKITPPAS